LINLPPVDEASKRTFRVAVLAVVGVIVGLAVILGLVGWAMYQSHFE
jgi:hypothetical protein